jgi:hypothetical protein
MQQGRGDTTLHQQPNTTKSKTPRRHRGMGSSRRAHLMKELRTHVSAPISLCLSPPLRARRTTPCEAATESCTRLLPARFTSREAAGLDPHHRTAPLLHLRLDASSDESHGGVFPPRHGFFRWIGKTTRDGIF